MFKFFDQILRPLAYAVLAIAGMPREVLQAYKRFLENLITYNVIAGGLKHGQPRACGIPQGCLFSMMVVALLMGPWIVLMRMMGMKSNVLADDVLLMARGQNMLMQLQNIERYAQISAFHGSESRTNQVV